MRKRSISLIVVLTFLLTLFPMALPAFAADYTRLGTVVSVEDGETVALSKVKIELSAYEVDAGDEVIISLPSDFEWLLSDPANTIVDTNSLVTFSATQLKDNEINLVADQNVEADTDIIITLGAVTVKEGFSGDITLKFKAPVGSGFDNGSVVVGRVTSGEVTVEVVEDETFSDDGGTVTIRIEEDRAGALEEDDESVKFILPDGFVWDSALDADAIGTGSSSFVFGGSPFAGTLEVDDEELMLNVTSKSTSAGGAVCIEIVADIEVDDETEAEVGDVVAKVRGKSDVSPSEITVGKYGNYEVIVTADDPETVYAGKVKQEIANITIEEAIEDSLINGRSITLTLPEWAKWGALDDSVSDSGVTLTLDSFPGKDGTVAKYTVTNTVYGGEAEIELEDMEVCLSPDAPEGDLEVEIGGTAGAKATVKVAEVKKPVVVETSVVPTIVIGRSGQAIADITITEAAEGMFNKDEILTVTLPKDVEWDDYEVTSLDGDLEIGDVDDDGRILTIEIDDDSNDISKLKITGTIVAYRTVPEGSVEAKIGGLALVEVNDTSDDGYLEDQFENTSVPGSGGYWIVGSKQAIKFDEDGLWEDENNVAKVEVAYVGTPAPGEQQIKAVFTLGSTTFTLNGVEQTMDVAPYAKNGRTYLPMRYVAKALGIKDSGILWKNGTATFISGNKVVSVKVGSTVMTINGAPVNMDVAPEIVNGRVMIPIRWIATAFDVDISWDAATQQVTVE